MQKRDVVAAEPRRTESDRWIAGGKPVPSDGGGPYPYGFRHSDAIGHEPGVTRRDPSDVVTVDDTYYVWYTKVLRSQRGYPSGYPGSVWYATSPDGKAWTERGPAVEPGPDDAWDGHGVFTPNILLADDKCYRPLPDERNWMRTLVNDWYSRPTPQVSRNKASGR